MQPTGQFLDPESGPTDVVDPPVAKGSAPKSSDVLPYLIPMCAYVALGALEGLVPLRDNRPSPIWYLAAYTAKLIAVGWIAWLCRSTWKDLRPFPAVKDLALSVVVGLVVWGLWVGLDGLYPPIPLVGRRIGFDPTTLAAVPRSVFFGVRLLGLVVLVPVIEELFWRSFLIRWLIEPEFQKVPIGHVTVMSAGATSVFFALVHPEWLPALLTGLLWAWLLRRSKSVSACAISHAIANLALGVYIIVAGAWRYW
jgi:CAAX prenyl protease-like protein